MPRCKTRACHTSYRSFECLFLTESAAKYDSQRVDKMNVPLAQMRKKKKMKERKEKNLPLVHEELGCLCAGGQLQIPFRWFMQL